MRPGLVRMRKLLARLAHPERSFRSVLVTGSNGKGTTCAVLASCLEHLGWTTGRFTSPHLESVRERFRVGGREAPYAEMRRFLKAHGAACHRLGATYFETTTAFALWWFREQEVEWAVLEIGLGGRLDACNAVDPELSVVTSVSLEHTEWLGPTQAHIAREKGGVARRGRPTLCGPLSPSALRALRRAVHQRGGCLVRPGPLFSIGAVKHQGRGSSFTLQAFGVSHRLRVPWAGEAAVVNAGLAAAAATYICTVAPAGTPPPNWKRRLASGVRRAHLPARLEQLSTSPLVVADVAHNEASLAGLVKDWRRLWPRKRPVILVGLLDDKPARKVGALLSKLSGDIVITRADSARAFEPAELGRLWNRFFDRAEVVPDRTLALDRALRRARGGSLLVTGSHYVVGPLLPLLRARLKKRAKALKQ